MKKGIVKQKTIVWAKNFIVIISLLSLVFLVACNKTDNSANDSIGKGDIPVENTEKEASNFLECESMSGDIMESYPRQCRLGDLHFTEIIEINESDEVKEPLSTDPEEESIDIEASKAELQQIFKDIEENMQVVDDNMQAIDVDDSELDSIGF